jgi:hypothetical protein
MPAEVARTVPVNVLLAPGTTPLLPVVLKLTAEGGVVLQFKLLEPALALLVTLPAKGSVVPPSATEPPLRPSVAVIAAVLPTEKTSPAPPKLLKIKLFDGAA